MKSYIILTYTITGLGGSITYVRNKINYVRTLGYIPIVFYCVRHSNAKVYVEELLDFYDNLVEDFIVPIRIYDEKERDSILNKIVKIIGECSSDSVIESHFSTASYWGEMLSEKLLIKHIVFLLQEKFEIIGSQDINFFKFKYDRRELVGIVNQSIPLLFSDYYDNIEPRYLPAYCNNVVEDICCPPKYCVKEEDVFCIGSIGRIDKEFVLPIMERIAKFTQRYPEHKFVVLCIGGSSVESDKAEILLKLFESYDNVKCLITGLIYPIPYSMITQMDVFVSTAGSAHISNKYGIPTISIDVLSFEAIGILGYTTSSALYKGDKRVKTLEEYIEDVFEGKYKKEVIEYEDYCFDFSSHLKFIEESDKTKFYFSFDVQKLSLFKMSKQDLKLYMIKKIGFGAYHKLFYRFVALKKVFKRAFGI